MALTLENKRLLPARKFLLGHTWSCLLRALWLFFPPLMFLLLAYSIFWYITQGKDLIVITLEDPKGRTTLTEVSCFIVALIFWVYVTWYSTRIIAKAKDFQHPDKDATWQTFLIQTPRVFAFTCLTIILLAFFRLNNYKYPYLGFWPVHILLALSYVEYYYIYKFWTWFLGQKTRNQKDWIKFLKKVRSIARFIMIAWIIGAILTKSFISIVSLLIIFQIGLVLLLIIRTELDEAEAEKKSPNPENINSQSKFWKKFRYLVRHDEDPTFFFIFTIISSIAVIIYLLSIIFIGFAVFIGPFPFLLLAFGILLGVGNIITYASVLIRFNCHLVIFLVALGFGYIFDSHKLHLPNKKENQPQFSQRQNLKEYFIDWINDPERQKILNDTTAPKYPVYFVMANGGASRSGYWTAKILGQLEDSTGGKFSKHLFCLSGASGGSVGTSTFFSLLRAKESLSKRRLSYAKAATDYLKSDFLTFTLSHLLGPDIFRNFLPFINFLEMDRGRALALSLEKAPTNNCFLYDSFSAKISSFITQKNNHHYSLPILCINMTRMRDGSPAVISNIRIQEDSIQLNYFNNRVDVLSLLNEESDMKLSTAVVLGASFPYISPAGRLDRRVLVQGEITKKQSIVYEPYYFVDGGYFDNSGAGVVNEMITAINNLMSSDPDLKKYKKRLEFFVIHISNTDPKEIRNDPINSVTNDLLAPAKTILGSYGAQTTVNDQRMKYYLYTLYKDSLHYNKIDLYDNAPDGFRFSMNWVISDIQRNLMDSMLLKNQAYQKEKNKMKAWEY